MEMVKSETYYIRQAKEEEWEKAMALAWETFLCFNAGEYTLQGTRSFFDFITDRELKEFFLNGKYKLFLAFDGGRIVGLITLRNGSHISLLFVDKEYQKQGVGSALITYISRYLIEEVKISYATVDAAPNAIGFYHKTGFWDLAGRQYRQGISYIPMKKNL